ncbi:MAG: DNA mismatch repair endonuclease MutL [Kiritimatiellia bacterium]
MINRDGHIRVLPLHVANKIAAGEVVERPASVVKELIENAIDAGAKNIRITVTQGGRKLVAVQDDGCGMTRDDAVLSLERQATSKILDVNDIEQIDTLGFRGEAIPSIASVSRFTITTRRHEADEGTLLHVNAGQLAEVRTAGCPPGTLVEVRDLFCNVPARRKFLRAYATEENHIKQIFTVHALAHPAIGFSLTVDGRELCRLAPAAALDERILDLFGKDFVADLLPIAPASPDDAIRVSGYIEKPNLNAPTRRDQYVFINGRPATAPSVAYALREAYPRRQGDVRPAMILFLDMSPTQVDVNVHPAKREVRFRDNTAVKQALMLAIDAALRSPRPASAIPPPNLTATPAARPAACPPPPDPLPQQLHGNNSAPVPGLDAPLPQALDTPTPQPPDLPTSLPAQVEFAVDPDATSSRPWQWFKFLAITSSGYILIETDAGIVTVNPRAARERIAYERCLYPGARDANSRTADGLSQTLLIPEITRLAPVDFARIASALDVIRSMGFLIEEFGKDTFKIDAVPQLMGSVAPGAILPTIARDLAEAGTRRGGERWREERIAKSIAKAYAGASPALTEQGATRLVEELCTCRSPYICPRGKPVMIFTSTRELSRKFGKE